MIVLIVNKNKEILNALAKNLFKRNDISLSDVIKQEDFSPVRTHGLFGKKKSCIWLDLTDKNKFNSFKKYIADKNNEKDIANQDLVITTVHFQGISPIEKLVKKMSGEIVKEKEVNVRGFLADYPLNKNVVNDIVDFVGSSYEKLLPLENSLKKMSREEIKNTSFEDILVMMPRTPGEIPIYQYLDSMIKGDMKNCMKDVDRSLNLVHPLVLLSLLKNKVNVIVATNHFYQSGETNYTTIAKHLGSHPYPIKLLFHIAKNKEKVERIASLCVELENKLKTSHGIDDKSLFKRYIAEITMLAGQ